MSDIKNTVNTYLYSAQTLAKLAEESANAGQGNSAIIGASLSLTQAWQTWLQELAGYLKISASEIEDESSEAFRSLPDCQFLFALKKDAGSWYKQIIMLSENPLFFYEKVLSNKRSDGGSLEQMKINIIDISRAEGSESDEESKSLLAVIEELKAYVQHTREQQTEW